MITVANRIYVSPEYVEEFEERFRNRAGLVDGMPGFILNRVLRPVNEGDPYIVFTSNMFAILGLRSLYFVLAGAIELFHYLKYGLALVLVFIGAKMLTAHWIEESEIEIPSWDPLAVVVTILFISIIASIIRSARRARNHTG